MEQLCIVMMANARTCLPAAFRGLEGSTHSERCRNRCAGYAARADVQAVAKPPSRLLTQPLARGRPVFAGKEALPR